jgi:hypothetical protein
MLCVVGSDQLAHKVLPRRIWWKRREVGYEVAGQKSPARYSIP